MTQFASPYFAAVDLGSNSFHMLIVRFNDDRIEIVDRVKEMVQIARGLKDSATLDAETQTRALDCLNRFAERLRDIPEAQVRAVGTKTLRTARNSKAFLKAAEKALGAPIQIISGYEEARLVYNGLANTVVNDHDQRLVVDIGGGSTEFIIGKSYDTFCMESLSLGCVTYTANFDLSPDKLSARNMRRAYMAACGELEEIRRNYLNTGWQVSYGTSGTMKAIAELLQDNDGGAVITKAALNTLIDDTIANGKLNAPNTAQLRRDVLPAGLAILQAIFDQLKLEKIHVADATLKEGLIYDTIGRFSDHDMRFTTVRKLEERYGIDTVHGGRVAKTAMHLWLQMPDLPLLAGVSRSKILSWAARLHEIGLSISHSNYHHHSYYILRYSDLAGFGRYEQYIMAALTRSHRKKISDTRFDGMDADALKSFLPLLFCLRIANILHRRRDDADILPSITVDDSQYQLCLDPEWLSNHPLTQTGLEQEAKFLKPLGVQLKLL